MTNQQFGVIPEKVIPEHLNWDAVDFKAPVIRVPEEWRVQYLTAYGLPADYGQYGENFSGEIPIDSRAPDAARKVYAAGNTPMQAIYGFCEARGLGEPILGGMLEESAGFTWGYRFRADDTGFKAAGIYVPGGVIMTWWK